MNIPFITQYAGYIKNAFRAFIIILILLLIWAVSWMYKELKFQRSENVRQTENVRQLYMQDSLQLSSQLITSKELNNYLQYANKTLSDKLAKDGIKPSRIESVITHNYTYKDTTRAEIDVSEIVDAIYKKIPKSQPWADSTKCQTTKGAVLFDGTSLKVIVSDREHHNKSAAVGYWERKQWSFLGIKSRLFGKKQVTSVTYDECGESKTMNITIKNPE